MIFMLDSRGPRYDQVVLNYIEYEVVLVNGRTGTTQYNVGLGTPIFKKYSLC